MSETKRLRPEKSEVNKLQCDNSLFYSLTKYSPNISLDQGLKNTIQWINSHSEINDFDKTDYNI